MFDEVMKKLRRLERGITISLPLEPDAKGYIDRECPAEDCKFVFKVHDEDWETLIRDEAVYCPQCGHEAPSSHWLTAEQAKQAEEHGRRLSEAEISGALRRDAQRWNSHQRGSFLQIRMEVRGSRLKPVPMPIQALEAMQRELQCSDCQASSPW